MKGMVTVRERVIIRAGSEIGHRKYRGKKGAQEQCVFTNAMYDVENKVRRPARREVEM